MTRACALSATGDSQAIVTPVGREHEPVTIVGHDLGVWPFLTRRIAPGSTLCA